MKKKRAANSLYRDGARKDRHSHRFKKPLLIIITILLLSLIFGVGLLYVKNISFQQPVQQELDFDVDQILIKVLVKSDDFATKEIRIMDISDEQVVIDLSLKGLSDIVTLDTTNFLIKPGQTKIVNLNISSVTQDKSVEQNPGIYTGKLLVKSKNAEKELPIIVEIESKNVLFDTNLNPVDIERKVEQGSDMIVEVRLFNLQSIDAENVNMEYNVKDINGNSIISESETVVVKTQASFFKTITIPQNLKPGTYVFAAESNLGASIGTSSYIFEIISPIGPGKGDFNFYSLCTGDVICLILLILVVLLVFSILAYSYFYIGAFIFQRIHGNLKIPRISSSKKQRELASLKHDLELKKEYSKLKHERHLLTEKEGERRKIRNKGPGFFARMAEKSRQHKLQKQREQDDKRRYGEKLKLERLKFEDDKRRLKLEEEMRALKKSPGFFSRMAERSRRKRFQKQKEKDRRRKYENELRLERLKIDEEKKRLKIDQEIRKIRDERESLKHRRAKLHEPKRAKKKKSAFSLHLEERKRRIRIKKLEKKKQRRLKQLQRKRIKEIKSEEKRKREKLLEKIHSTDKSKINKNIYSKLTKLQNKRKNEIQNKIYKYDDKIINLKYNERKQAEELHNSSKKLKNVDAEIKFLDNKYHRIQTLLEELNAEENKVTGDFNLRLKNITSEFDEQNAKLISKKELTEVEHKKEEEKKQIKIQKEKEKDKKEHQLEEQIKKEKKKTEESKKSLRDLVSGLRGKYRGHVTRVQENTEEIIQEEENQKIFEERIKEKGKIKAERLKEKQEADRKKIIEGSKRQKLASERARKVQERKDKGLELKRKAEERKQKEKEKIKQIEERKRQQEAAKKQKQEEKQRQINQKKKEQEEKQSRKELEIKRKATEKKQKGKEKESQIEEREKQLEFAKKQKEEELKKKEVEKKQKAEELAKGQKIKQEEEKKKELQEKKQREVELKKKNEEQKKIEQEKKKIENQKKQERKRLEDQKRQELEWNTKEKQRIEKEESKIKVDIQKQTELINKEKEKITQKEIKNKSEEGKIKKQLETVDQELKLLNHRFSQEANFSKNLNKRFDSTSLAESKLQSKFESGQAALTGYLESEKTISNNYLERLKELASKYDQIKSEKFEVLKKSLDKSAEQKSKLDEIKQLQDNEEAAKLDYDFKQLLTKLTDQVKELDNQISEKESYFDQQDTKIDSVVETIIEKSSILKDLDEDLKGKDEILSNLKQKRDHLEEQNKKRLEDWEIEHKNYLDESLIRKREFETSLLEKEKNLLTNALKDIKGSIGNKAKLDRLKRMEIKAKLSVDQEKFRSAEKNIEQNMLKEKKKLDDHYKSDMVNIKSKISSQQKQLSEVRKKADLSKGQHKKFVSEKTKKEESLSKIRKDIEKLEVRRDELRHNLRNLERSRPDKGLLNSLVKSLNETKQKKVVPRQKPQIAVKSSGFDKCNINIENSIKALDVSNFDGAKSYYTQAKMLYSSLTQEEKKQTYDKLMKLYNKLNS